MPSRWRPTGTRVSVTIPSDIGRRAARSARAYSELRRVASEITERADQLVPTDSGNLRDSQMSEVFLTPDGVAALIGYTAFYAHMVHNGTVKMAPNPWLLNAALSVMVTNRGRKAA